METKYSVNKNRIVEDIEHLCQYNATPGDGEGCTRFSYSTEDRSARNYLESIAKDFNITWKIDGVGNIHACYNPNHLEVPSVMIGSHIDTVPHGGKYDGLAGTISALEVLRVIIENKIEIKRPLELIIFAEEEGSNFGMTTFGSKVLTGQLSKEEIESMTTIDGNSAINLIKEFGLDVNRIGEEVIKRGEVDSFIELHIEQGKRLENNRNSIGIVTSITGMRTYSVTITGESNHAGTTPMNDRKDPLVAASKIIIAMEEFAKNQVSDTTVATVGKLDCYPSGSNVINSQVKFLVDIRDIDETNIEKMSDYLINKLDELSNNKGFSIEVTCLAETKPEKLSSRIVSALEDNAKKLGLRYEKLHSGAVHDTMMMASVADSCMIFVPSKDGISHSPYEYTSYEDIAKGADLLLATVVDLLK